MKNILVNCRHLKPERMYKSKLNQVQHECNAWQRLLAFMMDENIHLKNRLCEVLKNRPDNGLVEELETFLSRFIKQDELINLLRNDLVELNKLMKPEVFMDEETIKEIYRRTCQFHNNVLIAETRFSILKKDFNDYLSANA